MAIIGDKLNFIHIFQTIFPYTANLQTKIFYYYLIIENSNECRPAERITISNILQDLGPLYMFKKHAINLKSVTEYTKDKTNSIWNEFMTHHLYKYQYSTQQEMINDNVQLIQRYIDSF